MGEEGELKRIVAALKVDLANPDLCWKGQVSEVVDLAAKDFPKLWTDNSLSKVREAETFLEIMKWKEKWFGETKR